MDTDSDDDRLPPFKEKLEELETEGGEGRVVE